MRWCHIVLIVAALSPSGVAAQAAQQSGRPGESPPARQESPAAVVDRLPISIDNIRKELQERPPGPPAIRMGELPTFRVTIVGRKPLMVEFQETLRQPWQPIMPGGTHNKAILDMITPPQARPYGAFVNTDLLQVAVTSFVNALAQKAAVKGYQAAKHGVRDWREARIREEVQAELEAFKRANAVAPLPQLQNGEGWAARSADGKAGKDGKDPKKNEKDPKKKQKKGG